MSSSFKLNLVLNKQPVDIDNFQLNITLKSLPPLNCTNVNTLCEHGTVTVHLSDNRMFK